MAASRDHCAWLQRQPRPAADRRRCNGQRVPRRYMRRPRRPAGAAATSRSGRATAKPRDSGPAPATRPHSLSRAHHARRSRTQHYRLPRACMARRRCTRTLLITRRRDFAYHAPMHPHIPAITRWAGCTWPRMSSPELGTCHALAKRRARRRRDGRAAPSSTLIAMQLRRPGSSSTREARVRSRMGAGKWQRRPSVRAPATPPSECANRPGPSRRGIERVVRTLAPHVPPPQRR